MAADLADEPADGRVRPVRLVAEHVVADELDDPVTNGPRRVEPVEERAGQLRAGGVVTEEVALGEGRRLADVVEQGGEPDDRPVGRGGIDGPERVVPEVLARDLVLGDAALGGEVGRDRGEEAGLGQQPQPDRRRRRAEQLVQLGGDPLARQVGDQSGAVPRSRPASPARP